MLRGEEKRAGMGKHGRGEKENRGKGGKRKE